MNNIEKKLDAIIDALGFDVEEAITRKIFVSAEVPSFREFTQGCDVITTTDYKLTKRNSKQEKVKVWEICSKCKGAGIYEHLKCTEECSHCKGSGKVLI